MNPPFPLDLPSSSILGFRDSFPAGTVAGRLFGGLPQSVSLLCAMIIFEAPDCAGDAASIEDASLWRLLESPRGLHEWLFILKPLQT
jgi:hypothetical protein